MNFPASLHLPGIFGTMIGMGLCLEFWDTNKPLALVLLCVLMGGGTWLGVWLSDRFFKSLKGDK